MTRNLNLLLILIISILLAVTSGLAISGSLEKTGTCSNCHQMTPYVSSYLEPSQGSVLTQHTLDCLGCHTNISTGKARETLLKEISVNVVNKITGLKFKVATGEMAVNCTRCHVMEDSVHLISTRNSSCESCHWAHLPSNNFQNITAFNTAIISYGPHINQTCQNCHGTDFRIPRCINCHSGHGDQKLENELCLGCHIDPHIPEKIGKYPEYKKPFKEKLPFETCMPCHENEYFDVAYSYSKHTNNQTCTDCHEIHGEIPNCENCHHVMQSKKHPEFYCKNCHLSNDYSKITCFDCHGRKVHDLTASSAQWNPK